MQIRAISDTGGSERTRHGDSQAVACNFLMFRIGTCSVLSSQIAESIAPFACSGTSRGSKIRVANLGLRTPPKFKNLPSREDKISNNVRSRCRGY